MLYLVAADFILLVHTFFVAFIVVGLAAIVVGKFRSWSWVRNPWFRCAHLAGIGVVVLQSWLGALCPGRWRCARRPGPPPIPAAS